MAYGINGYLERLQDPIGIGGTSLNRKRNWTLNYETTWTVNSPIVHSVRWNGAVTDADEPSPANFANNNGDVVNVIFDIYETQSHGAFIFPDDWTLVASIRKSRDIRNISNKPILDGGGGGELTAGHVFTVDISEILKDLLSYSLLPHGKGTYTNWRYGGLNGGAKPQDNLAQNVWTDNFILTKNGSFRKIQLRYRTEIIDGDGIIQEATEAGSFKDSAYPYSIINSAPDYDSNQPTSVNGGAGMLMLVGWGSSSDYPKITQSLCPNYNFSTTFELGKRLTKDVRMNENNEVVSWIQRDMSNYPIWSNASVNPEGLSYNIDNTSDLITDAYILVTAYSPAGAIVREARLYDWTQNLNAKMTIGGGNPPNTAVANNVYPRYQYIPCAQNISPVFINANCIHNSSTVQDVWENGGTTYTRYRIDTDGATGNPKQALFLNDEIAYYMISQVGVTTTDGNGTGVIQTNRMENRWFKIDRERERATPLYDSGATSQYYAGIYYTELRTDALTATNPIRCKGLWWNENERPFIRIYWLNKAGGIDAYTFKGQIRTSYNASRDVILRPQPNRHAVGSGVSSSTFPLPYPSNNAPTKGFYQSDTLRDANVYNGGLEVLNVDGTKSGVVGSLPLNKIKAEWLREIISSPNVWTEHSHTYPLPSGETVINRLAYRSVADMSRGYIQDGRHPSNMDYSPIIITNSEVDVYDESKGLVTMNIEYTYAHAVVTQRN